MEIVGTIVSVMGCLCAPTCFHQSVANECTYLKNPLVAKEILRSKMEILSAREDDVKTELRRAKEQEGKDPKREIEIWLKNVEKAMQYVENIIEVQVERRCLNGFFPNYFSRRNTGKRLAKNIKEVTELLEIGQFPNGLAIDLSLDNGMMIPTTTLVGRTTADRNLKLIWAHLIDNKVERIGVYGMGGVGKTTIMTHVNNQLLKETNRFDNVIWVTVSKAFQVEKLQNDIAKAVKLDLSNDEDEIRRASKLFKELKGRRRFVLILDDMWEAFPLEKVGIPEPSGTNGCKLVLTTRSLEVCRKMGCQENIKVEVLAENEAWNLFMDKVGRDVLLNPEVEAVAKLVCKECSRLPLAIIAIGGAMSRVDDIIEWKKALNDLGRSTKEVMGMEEEVFEKLKFSYQRLKDEKFQKCFLYCTLYPEDDQIYTEELIGYWIAEGFIDNGSRQADFDEGQVILNKLKNTCLLEEGIRGPSTEYVKMHDLIRDMALKITNMSPRCMIKAGVGLQELSKEEEWTWDLERVSLMKNKLKTLSCEPKCPRVSALLLQHNKFLREISDTFFEHMHGLKVLDLSSSKIKSLPDSLSNLENLRALILFRCEELRKVPSLAKLNELRELDLCGTGIEEVPQGMDKLVKLQRLNLTGIIGGLKMFPGILPNLSSLQDLRMGGSVWKCRRDEELLSLAKLEYLHVVFCSFSVYNSYVRSWQMRRLHQFNLLVHGISWSSNKKKAVSFGKFEVKGEDTPLVIPENTQSLRINKCNDVIRLSQFCFLKNVGDLQEICVLDCNGLECIISTEEEGTFLQSVEELQLCYLENLRNICKGLAPRGSFSSLKMVEIRSCNNMKNLFSHGMLQYNNLQNLQCIRVNGCEQMEDVIGSSEEEKVMGEGNNNNNNIINTLPRLKELTLDNLPSLKSICRGALFSDSLRSIRVIRCYELKRVPIKLVEKDETPPHLSTPALEDIRGSQKWWDSVEWDHPNAKTLLQPFFHTWGIWIAA